jgi:hypothetical protein
MFSSRSLVSVLSVLGVFSLAVCSSGGGGGGTGGSSSGGNAAGETGQGGNAAGESGSGGSGGGSAGESGTGGVVATGGTRATGGSTGTGGTKPAVTGGAGGTAPATGGTPGGAVDFTKPCPASGNCKILSFGDSIAVGAPGTAGGYRATLSADLSIYRAEFVGSKTSAGGTAASKPHEGTADDDAAKALTKLPDAVSKNAPHIIILNVGSEDVENSLQAAFEGKLNMILDKIRMAAPAALVLVVHPNPTTNSGFNTRLVTVDNLIKKIIDARVGKGFSRVIMRPAFAPDYQVGQVDGNLLSGTKYLPSAAGYAQITAAIKGSLLRYLIRK